jgi:hypothetical protein
VPPVLAWQTKNMAAEESGLASEVARYAATFHDVLGYRHLVASPLGAWLLLALCAPAASGENGAALTEVLGGGAEQVASQAAALLAVPHPLVAAAAAVWSKPGAADAQWLAGLPAVVTKGDIPGQDQLDQWARDHTFGLIETFPVRVTPLVDLLLATALATKVSWDRPFDLAPGSALGEASPWRHLARVLKSPDDPSHSAFIAVTDQAGEVAVHAGRAQGGLLVCSVIAQPDVAPALVLRAAHQIAIAMAVSQQLPTRSLFDLPLGSGSPWSVSEETSSQKAGEHCTALLPAWSATSRHDLSDHRLGFTAAAAALGSGRWQAVQSAKASYTRTGFEAAAVTTAVRMMAMRARSGRYRTAELRFGHPYAVVAVTVDDDAAAGAWRGLPVFSAWVAEPASAEGQ